jgi:glycosyltransferase involved in cell wall biosynthesis
MDKLKILLVTTWPLANEAGGVSTMVRSLAAGLSRRYDVQVLVPDWKARTLCSSVEAGFVTHRLCLRVPCHAETPVKNLAGWIRDFPLAFRQLLNLLRSQRFDIVHLHFGSAYHYFFRLAHALAGPPYVVTLHRGETVNFPFLSRCERALMLWSLRGAARIVAVSEWLRRLAKETFPRIGEIDCIYNGYDLFCAAGQQSMVLREDLKVRLPEVFFLMVANVTYYKGQDIAIRAWAEVKRRFPYVHLIIVGERREFWDFCTHLVRELGCEDVVHMLGALPHAQVLALMERALGLIMPSRNEGFGLVILEAGLKHLPIVCSRIGPFLEIVEDGSTAIVVPPEDPLALSIGVARLIQDADLRQQLGSALESRVRTNFSVQRMADQYEWLYRQVCAL